MKASASDPDLHSIGFYVDGNKVTGFSGDKIAGGKSVSMLWHGASKLSYGTHTVTVRASDGIGNVSSQDVVVRHVHPNEITDLQRVKLKVKVRGKGLTLRVTGRVVAPRPPGGRVHVTFQVRRKHRWANRHTISKNANHPFRVTQRLARAGRWRVHVRFMGSPPFKAKAASSKPIRAR
jgi:hypothetical protein